MEIVGNLCLLTSESLFIDGRYKQLNPSIINNT